MVWIHLESPELNQARVASRVSEGGHPVPADKVISRIPRLLRHVRASIPLVDVLRIYDNSCLDDPFRPVLSITQGVLERHQNPLPLWASDWLADMDAPS